MENFVFGVLGAILYPLFGVLFLIIDAVQSAFFAFAGISEISFGGSVVLKDQLDSDGGIVYFLFQNSVVKNMLMSIMLLALFLIIIFTVMAFIKNAYSAKPKGWKEIIGNSIKGLANFIFIPVCCLLGVWLGNILLQAINGATSYKGSTEMSRTLFVASAYNANQFRTGESGADQWDELKAFAEQQTVSGTSNKYDASYIKEGMTTEELANALDDVYASTDVSYHLQWHISDWYNVGLVNYLVLAAGGVFMLYVLCSLAFAMVRRLFLLLILFIISPGVCAMYPLDEGKAVGSWKTKFFEQVVSAYGAVAGLNIFFSLIPIIGKIELFGGPLAGFLNCIIQIFILVCGLLVVNEFISLISGFVGGEDAYSKGKSTMSSTLAATKKYGGGAVTGAFGAVSKAKAQAKAEHTGFWGTVGNLTKNTLGSGLTKLTSTLSGGIFDPDAIKKQKEASEKEGTEKAYADQKKRNEKREEAENSKFAEKALGKKGKDGLYTQDAIDTALESAGTDEKKRKAIFDLVAASRNSIKGGGNYASDLAMKKTKKDMEAENAAYRAEQIKNGVEEKDVKDKYTSAAIDKAAKKAGSSAKSRHWLLNDDKVYTSDKLEEEFKKAESSDTAKVAAAAAQTGFNDAQAKYDKLENDKKKFKKKHESMFEGDEMTATKVTSGTLKVLEIQAQKVDANGNFTADAITAQHKLEAALNRNENIDKWVKMETDSAAAKEAMEGAAEKFASVMERIAESEKAANAAAIKAAAEDIKNAVAKSNDTKAIVDAIEGMSDDVKKLLAPKKKSSGGTGGTTK